MKIVLAPDSFKESMTAKEVADAMERGIKRVMPEAQCIKIPMADGGEGTVQSLVDATGGVLQYVTVTGPLGIPVEAVFGLLGDGDTAVIEMASASGLHLVPMAKRNPLVTTTYGTGELIKAALDQGVKKILIGIGGSATNDGGAGMFQALGGRLLDTHGRELAPGGGQLNELCAIDMSGLDRRLTSVSVEVACDVNNPLTGLRGASAVFGPQKGATPEIVKRLDDNLKHYAKMIKQELQKDIEEIPGAGAAGGLGAGLMAFLSAELVRGIDLVLLQTNLEAYVQGADFVWTGEGSIDEQTQYGKTPMGVASVAKRWNVPVIVLAGKIGKGIEVLYEQGITSIFGILPSVMDLEEALKTGSENVERTSESVARLLVKR